MRLRSHYYLLGFSIVVPVAVFCGLALSMLQDVQHRSAIERIEQSASLTAKVVDADIARARSVLKALAYSHALEEGRLADFHDEAKAASAAPGGWIILYDSKGQQLVNTRRAIGDALPVRPDPDTVSAMLASGQGQVSDIKWGHVLKNYFVMVEMPIMTASGKQYVIGQAFSPAFFAHSFAGNALPTSWRVAILDRAGVIIARSDRADEFIGKTVRPATLEVLRNSRSGVLRHFSGNETEVYDAYTRSELSDWSVIIGAPVSEVDAAVWRGVSVMSAGLFIALAAALTLTMLAGRHLVRFVRRASHAAAALGRGDAALPLPRSGIHELEGLNEALREADRRLQDEMASRAAAEQERNALLVSEKTARARAEEQNAAKDEFLAMLGHELRNPLSAVASAVSILDVRGIDEQRATRARDVLRRQTGHLRKLVDDLLEVNRALMGKLELDKQAVDMANVVQRCIDTLRADERSAAFELQVTAAPAPVLADPTRLLQVLDNLLDNALKYSPNGGRIVVTAGQEGDHAVLTVQDSGQGIAPDLLPFVFDIFVQGKQSLQRSHGGLGIGLSLVRRLVELHGGTVDIASAGTGCGTTATVRLPLLTDSAEEADAPVAGEAPLPSRRVLLVEDNHDARDMMSMLLALRDCDVIAAASGPEGIALALDKLPDIAFIDIGLPGMDGYAVARVLSSDPRTAHITLIALTGYGSANDRDLALSAGFARHYTKPIRIEDLQAALA